MNMTRLTSAPVPAQSQGTPPGLPPASRWQLPTGCRGDECPTRPQRDWSPLAAAPVAVAFALVAASALGILVLARSKRARTAISVRLGRAATLSGAAGLGLMLVGLAGGTWGPAMDVAMPGFSRHHSGLRGLSPMSSGYRLSACLAT